MTLIAGIVCKDGIVVAADSQVTAEPTKMLNTNKVNVINFPHLKRALLAEAGVVSLSNRVVDLVKAKAANADIVDENTIPLILQESVMQVRGEQMKLYPGHHPLAEWSDFFQQRSAVALILAYYHNHKPHLYTISIDECFLYEARDHFAVRGCGDFFGNYLLREHTTANMPCALGAVMAVKVAQEVSRYVEGCGMPIKAAIIQSPPDSTPANELEMMPAKARDWLHEDRTFVFPDAHIEQLAAIITKEEIATRTARSRRILGFLKKEHARSIKAMNAAYDRELRMAAQAADAASKSKQ